MKNINNNIVLSLFDGMSCGQIALKELGHSFKYYASEIDKFAIQQTQYNFPDTVQLGDIENWRGWDIEWTKVRFILAGSPCQGFSFAGKQLNFNDPRSKLFFVFVDILRHAKKYNPDVKFLLENVNMKKEYQKVINDCLGLFPVRINSNLVSAQNRDRLYWTNIRIKQVGLFNEIHADIPQPEDRKIYLKDILQDESDIDRKYYVKLKAPLKAPLKSFCIDANYFKGGNLKQYTEKKRRQLICVSMVGRKIGLDGKRKDNDKNIKAKQRIEPAPENKTNCLTSVQKDNLLTNGYYLRRLTPIECARLQTVPKWYKFMQSEDKPTSDTQIYKMLGNGWTIEIIKHILKYL